LNTFETIWAFNPLLMNTYETTWSLILFWWLMMGCD
jgi:hypothetical protein